MVTAKIVVLVSDMFSQCSAYLDSYINDINSVNHDIKTKIGDGISEAVANRVSTEPISDVIKSANDAASFLVQNCDYSENAVRTTADYSSNIYASLEMYKHTTPQAIPEFGEMSFLITILAFGGFGIVMKRREIMDAFRKLFRK